MFYTLEGLVPKPMFGKDVNWYSTKKNFSNLKKTHFEKKKPKKQRAKLLYSRWFEPPWVPAELNFCLYTQIWIHQKTSRPTAFVAGAHGGGKKSKEMKGK